MRERYAPEWLHVRAKDLRNLMAQGTGTLLMPFCLADTYCDTSVSEVLGCPGEQFIYFCLLVCEAEGA